MRLHAQQEEPPDDTRRRPPGPASARCAGRHGARAPRRRDGRRDAALRASGDGFALQCLAEQATRCVAGSRCARMRGERIARIRGALRGAPHMRLGKLLRLCACCRRPGPYGRPRRATHAGRRSSPGRGARRARYTLRRRPAPYFLLLTDALTLRRPCVPVQRGDDGEQETFAVRHVCRAPGDAPLRKCEACQADMRQALVAALPSLC